MVSSLLETLHHPLFSISFSFYFHHPFPCPCCLSGNLSFRLSIPVHLTVVWLICLDQSVLPEMSTLISCVISPLTTHFHQCNFPSKLTFIHAASWLPFSSPCYYFPHQRLVFFAKHRVTPVGGEHTYRWQWHIFLLPRGHQPWNQPGIGYTVTDPLSWGHICPLLSLLTWEVAPVSRWGLFPCFLSLHSVSSFSFIALVQPIKSLKSSKLVAGRMFFFLSFCLIMCFYSSAVCNGVRCTLDSLLKYNILHYK